MISQNVVGALVNVSETAAALQPHQIVKIDGVEIEFEIGTVAGNLQRDRHNDLGRKCDLVEIVSEGGVAIRIYVTSHLQETQLLIRAEDESCYG